MEAGTYVGKIQVVLGDEILYEKSFYLEEDIYKKTIKDYILEGIHNLFRPTQTNIKEFIMNSFYITIPTNTNIILIIKETIYVKYGTFTLYFFKIG